jgi:hypothetical protein
MPASGETAIRSAAGSVRLAKAWILDEEKKTIVNSLEFATGSVDR